MSGINLVLFEPEAAWKPKLEFPAMTGVKKLSVDVETKDPYIKELGPGTFRKDGYPVGIGIALDTGFKAYYPIAHEMGGNLPRGPVIQFFTDILRRPEYEFIGMNTGYDLEWLKFMGIDVVCPVRDVGVAEALIDEESRWGYGLDGIAQKYLGFKKDEELLNLAASAYETDPKSGLWMLHSKYVGPYGEMDPWLTLKCYEKQEKILKSEGLEELHNMESELIQIIFKMRQQGVRVNVDKAEKLAKSLKKEEEEAYKILRSEVGFAIDVWSGKSIAKGCSLMDLPIPRTLKGNASFNKNFLQHSDHKFFKQIQNIRTLNRLRTLFVEDLIFKFQVNGRIHSEFQQLVWEEGGTRSGRFASNNPNLQQIPSRDKIIAPKIRSLFIPNEFEKWGKFDYSQQEPRILTHYAFLMKYAGAAKVRQAYLEDKTSDYYNLISKEARLARDKAKIVSLGITYGEGKDKLARDLGMSVDEAEALKGKFNAANPFIRQMAEFAMSRAEQKGYIRTLLGRRRRFNLWEPKWSNTGKSWFKEKEREPALSLEAATDKWQGKVPLKRAFTYKALNALVQGSAADMTKAAMVQVYRQLGKIPLLQVHDELDYSVTSDKEADAIRTIMEQAIPLTVPIYADPHIGDHWK